MLIIGYRIEYPLFKQLCVFQKIKPLYFWCWILLKKIPKPSVYRHNFHFVYFHGKLFTSKSLKILCLIIEYRTNSVTTIIDDLNLIGWSFQRLSKRNHHFTWIPATVSKLPINYAENIRILYIRFIYVFYISNIFDNQQDMMIWSLDCVQFSAHSFALTYKI